MPNDKYVKHNRDIIPEMFDWANGLEPRFRDAVIDNLVGLTVRFFKFKESTESPIEFLMAMYLRNDILWNFLECNATVELQKEIVTAGGKYRADFLVTAYRDSGPVRVVVECDGHDFHEKTKEQAQRDKKRDRALQTGGYRVLRFTGSEIWKNPIACVKEVANLIKAEV